MSARTIREFVKLVWFRSQRAKDDARAEDEAFQRIHSRNADIKRLRHQQRKIKL